MASEIYRTGRAATEAQCRENAHDFGNAVNAAISVLGPGGDPGPFYGRALRRAERILRRDWRAVTRLAAALLKSNTLPGRQVRAIVRSAQAAD